MWFRDSDEVRKQTDTDEQLNIRSDKEAAKRSKSQMR